MAASLLRFIMLGSVDDGKSTLIGRLLHDAGQVPDDVLAEARSDSRRVGTRGQEIDYALLVDGLTAEREQGITIDVAYRYFASGKRSFIVADAPGHEQYTRNMVTGASTAELAVVLVDASAGLLTQTRRHAFIAGLLGIHNAVLAVTKMDLVGYDEQRFRAIEAEFASFGGEIGINHVAAIPLSGVTGDNVVERSALMPWYSGPTLLEHLETVEVGGADEAGGFRLPVQLVHRPDAGFRGYTGTIASGAIKPGDAVRLVPSGRTSRIERIVTSDGDLAEAAAGRAVTLTLADQVDCSRGEVIAAANDPPHSADRFEASLVWLGDDPLVPGRGYGLRLATQSVTATVQPPKYEINVDSREHLAVKTLEMNALGVAEIATDRAIAFDPYATNRTLGGFILIDKVSGATVACGMLHFALRRAENVHWQALEVSREAHAAIKGQKPAVLWFTGLSGAGKSTIANLVEKKLHAMGRHSFLLDGDNLRQGLNQDLGFTETDRIENIRRAGEVARLMADAGLIVVTAFISPFAAERALVRSMFLLGEFIEVFIDTPLAEAERRDTKGLYAKARAGELANFTGIDSPYEPPENPEIRIDTTTMTAEAAAEAIIAELQAGRRL